MSDLATETFTGTDGAALPAQWVAGFTPSVGTGGGATIEGNRARFRSANHTVAYTGNATVSRRLTLAARQDASLYYEFELQTPSDGAPFQAYLRANDAVDTGAGLAFEVDKLDSTRSATIASYTEYSRTVVAQVAYEWAAGVIYKVRFEAFGTTARARIWTGATEPTTWTMSGTVTATSGRVGFRQGHGAAGANQDAFLDNVAVDSTAYTAPPAGDTTAPTVPSGVTATATGTTTAAVSWTASTDAVGVSSYRVQRDGVTVAAAVAGTSFDDSGLTAGAQYSYTVSAVDAAGNRSVESTAATVTTSAPPPTYLPDHNFTGPARVIAKAFVERATAATLHTIPLPTTRTEDGGGALTLGPTHTIIVWIARRAFTTTQTGAEKSGWNLLEPTETMNGNGCAMAVWTKQAEAADNGTAPGFGYLSGVDATTLGSYGGVALGVLIVEGASGAVPVAMDGSAAFAGESGGSVSTSTTTPAAISAADVLWVHLTGGPTGASVASTANTPGWDFHASYSAPLSNRMLMHAAADTKPGSPALTQTTFSYSPNGGTDGYNYAAMTLALAQPDVYLLDHSFDGAAGSTFTSDAKYAHLAGSKPSIVRASFSKGLRFDGDGQSIVQHVYSPAPGAGVINHDRIYRLSSAVTATGEVWQARVGTARGPGYAFTSDNRLRLLKVEGVNGISSGTTTATLPVGVPFRVAMTTNGATVTIKLYANDTTTTPLETLTSATSDNVAVTAVRDGVITVTGLGAGVWLDVFYPQDSRTLVPGPRAYDLPTDGPQALAAQPLETEPWRKGVTLTGTAVQESNPIASQTWTVGAGNPAVLDPGTGPVRTFTAPASLDAQSLPFTFTVTDTAGLSSSTTVNVPVLPATYAVWQDGQMVPLEQHVYDAATWENVGTPPATATITVTGFTPLPTEATAQQWTFTTNAGVEFTRITEWRTYTTPASTLPWTTSDIRQRADIHTATVSGLPSGSDIEGRITLSRPGYTTRVLTSTEFPSLRFTTPTTSTPTEPTPPSGDRLLVPPPLLAGELVVNIPAEGGSVKVPEGRDVRLVAPNVPVTGQFTVGGTPRNIVMIGGQFKAGSTLQACLKVEFYTGTCFIEGVDIDPTGGYDHATQLTGGPNNPSGPPWYGDAIRTNSSSPTSHFVGQNLRLRSNGISEYLDGTKGPHGDCIQTWDGPARMTLDKVTMETYYQGVYAAANDPAFGATNVTFGTWTFSRVNIWRRVPSGGARAWEVSGPTDVVVVDCYARREPNSSISTVSHVNGDAENLWVVSTTAPPSGDFVPAGVPGIGYVSPGYGGSTPTNPPPPASLTEPTSVTATTTGTTATLNWQPPTSGTVAAYVVGRDGTDSTGYGAYSGDVASTARTVTFDKLVPGATYILSVRAKAADGTLGPAVTRSITVAGAPVVTPPPGGTLTVNGRTFPSINTASGGSGLPWNGLVFTGSWTTSTADTFGTWRGRPVDGMTAWVPWTGSWAETRTFPSIRSTGLYVLGVPLHPRGVNTTNAAVAAGTWDAEITAWANAAKAAGYNQTRVAFRLGWECNGTWYPWSWDKGGVANYIAAYRRFVNVCRAAGLTNPFWSWNLNKGPQAYNSGYSWRTGFPGTSWVDIVGIDSYDHYSPTFTLANWESNVGMSKNPGIRDVAAFATEQGILWALEEWGVANPKGTDRGGDNAYYIARTWDILNEYKGHLAYEITYDDEGAPATLNHKLSNGTNPLAAAAYRASTRWGAA